MLELVSKAKAQIGDIDPLQPVQPGANSPWNTPAEAIVNILNIILFVAGALAVGYLIYGGILYITAGGDSEKATKGKTAVINSVIGIIIILAALIIINWVRGFVNTGNID